MPSLQHLLLHLVRFPCVWIEVQTKDGLPELGLVWQHLSCCHKKLRCRPATRQHQLQFNSLHSLSNCKMYLSQFAKCICQDLLYLSKILNLPSRISKYICLKFQNWFVYNFRMYFSKISKCIWLKFSKYICLKLKNIFVSNWKMYLCQIADCICFNLQNVFF